MFPPPGLVSALPQDATAAVASSVVAAVVTALPHIGVDPPTPTNMDLATAMASLVGAVAATATASASSLPTSTNTPDTTALDDGDIGHSGECRLLGPFALLVQVALGGLALMSLVYKRWRERPQRPLKIWFFDASKQVFGSLLVHVANVFMSMLTSGRFSIKLEPAAVTTAARMASRLLRRDEDEYTPNPCSFYLLNLAIDTTIGIPILIILVRVCTGLVSFTPLGQPPESIQSGNYGSPPRTLWWFKQSIIYFCGLFGMKVCVLIIFLVLPWISRVGDWALGWTEGNEKLQIVFVMMLFPLIMNALQYYIIDSYIKNQHVDHVPLPSDDPGASAGEDGGRLSLTSTGLTDDEEEALTKTTGRRVDEDSEYDPDVDGDAPTIIGSSSSRVNEQNILRTGLYPKE